MPKIIQFPTTQVNVQEWLKASTKHISHSTPIVMAMKLPDGSVQTAYWNSDFGTIQELLSHMQIDVMMDVTKMNIGDILGEE